MSSPFDRQRAERLALAIKERKLRDERAAQSDLGAPGRLGGLIHFIRYFWHILEPATPMVDGWVMHAICLHLEAVTRGEIKRLLINVPPGCSKSLIVNVFWPAWEWGPARLPHLRYVTFAYASHLTERDNGRFRDVIQSVEYRDLWGREFTLTANGVVKPSNDAKGWKFSSSIDGVGTGERGNRVLCLPPGQMVATERGPMTVERIVEQNADVRVWSFNHASGELELKAIEAYEVNPPGRLVEIETECGRRLVCTSDHLVFTVGSGYKKACDLTPDDEVVLHDGEDGPDLQDDVSVREALHRVNDQDS